MTRSKATPRKTTIQRAAKHAGASASALPSSGVAEPAGTYYVKMHEAKTTLSKLIRLVERGSRVVISRDDIAIAELVPVRTALAAGRPRQFGALRGVVAIGPAFFEPLPADELAAWE
jgi:antitoxin (DNA-binding transcriptional repressor) of toxin-antitoxin stability system